ncbi:hypothetical protein ACWEPM_32845 [Streptomyces sp. NPDC004244]
MTIANRAALSAAVLCAAVLAASMQTAAAQTVEKADPVPHGYLGGAVPTSIGFTDKIKGAIGVEGIYDLPQ